MGATGAPASSSRAPQAPSASQSRHNGESSSSASSSSQAPSFEYPRTVAQSLKPTIGSFIPHTDHIKKSFAYLTDAAVEYEEFYGQPGAKTAGSTDKPSSRKPIGRSKAALAAHASQQAFSQDSQIHQMEDAILAAVDIQYQMEAERAALESLTGLISMGGKLPGKDLQISFQELLKTEIKLQQNQRKQQQKQTGRDMDRPLLDFRTKVWDYHHMNEPMPVGNLDGVMGEDDEDDEMEIVMTGDSGQQSLKCPLTTKFLEDPVTSSSCKHSFSKDAIMSMIASQRQTLCPVHGCSRPITAGMLQSNKALARKVAREKLIQEEMSQAQEDEYTTVE
ncbi:hypothetical protein BGZ93_010295 [Podila epicladia]|nr:hypothetical protein BGZ93_010295 [Podila epicladia]KAG0090689.1 hypothetical protein BGZ92_002407 [Podila epicladia]